MKVLLIGGTGTLSMDTTELCISKGYEVYLFNRGNKNKYVGKNVHYIIGDINNAGKAIELIGNLKFDVVVDYLTYNVQTLKKRVTVFEGRTNQYIFISSATVFPITKERISENSPIGNDGWIYAKEKLQCERYLKQNIFSFQYTIVRPYVTYGDKRIPFPIISKKNSWNLIYRIDNNKPILMCGDGNQKVTLTNTRDFAIGITGLFLNEWAFNEEFNIVGDTEVTWNDVIKKIERTLGKAASVINVDTKILANKINSISEELCFDKAHVHIFDNTKIKTVVPEFVTIYDLEKGLDITLNNLMREKELQIIDDDWNAMEDILCYIYSKKRENVSVSFSKWFKYLKKESKYIIKAKERVKRIMR